MNLIIGVLWGLSLSIGLLLFYIDNYYEGTISIAERETIKTMLVMVSLPLGILLTRLDLFVLLGFIKYIGVVLAV